MSDLVIRRASKTLSSSLILFLVFSPLQVFAQVGTENAPPSTSSSTEVTSPVESPEPSQEEGGFIQGETGTEETSVKSQESEMGEEGSGGESLLGSEEGDPIPIPSNVQLFTYQSIAPRVEDATGALVQRVPLEIPPGRNGLTPEVALIYNSQDLRDDTAVGYGWALSIPYIERMNKIGSENLYNAGFFYSSLGGELATTTSATEYRHRVEDGRFITYTFSNNVWEAYDKNGTRYRFGYTSSAQQGTTSPERIYKWMLEEVRDANNNFIKYEYTKDQDQIYPSKITYTGHNTTDGIFEIDFTYETRPDFNISYKSAYRVDTKKRLTQIQASVNDSWVRRYALSYTTGHNGYRSLLKSVQQTGRDENLTELSLPALTFGYSSSTPAYLDTTNPHIKNPAYLAADLQGDGLPERTVLYREAPFLNLECDIERNFSPDGFSTYTTCATIPNYWANDFGTWAWLGYSPTETGVRLVDVSGDGKADVVQGLLTEGSPDTQVSKYYENSSTYLLPSWVEIGYSTTTIPIFGYRNGDESYSTGLLGNLNGDGLIDYTLSISTGSFTDTSYLHQATTSSMWTATTTIFAPYGDMPTTYNSQVDNRLIDINNDGLDDWMHTSSALTDFCLNNGTGWTNCTTPWAIATSTLHANGWDRGIRFVDINGDSLLDYVRSYVMPSYTLKNAGVQDIQIGEYNYVYLNTGYGFATSTLTVPANITTGSLEIDDKWGGDITYNELVDWNGDGLPDDKGSVSTSTATARQDLLTQIVYPTTGTTTVQYKYSSQFGNNAYHSAYNPDLPFPVLIVTKITDEDGMGNTKTTEYEYKGGKMYLAGDIRDRRFATFREITKTDPLGVTRTYFHQGNEADTASGELTDSYAHIGRPYREITVSLASTTMQYKFFRWDADDLGTNNRSFIHLGGELVLNYDGDGDHRDTAVEYSYSTTTGDLTYELRYGEVTGSTNGTYTDTGSDKITRILTYSASSTSPLSVPREETIYDNSSTTVKISKFYYDDLSAGSVTKGNLTKQEGWIESSTYASSTKAYNTYGLVTSETDPRSKTTTHTYDTNNLYVATTTNPLSQETGSSYDLATGKPKIIIDANDRTRQFIYDPVGRLKETKVPDPSSGTLVTKSTVTYTDSEFPRKQQETMVLSSATTTDKYTYFDGFGRTIQERVESSNSYFVKDSVYGSNGLLHKESLPYFSSGSARTIATTSSAMLTTYAYDALQRITSIQNVEGTETHAYDQWEEVITDREGNTKDFTKDAHGRLVQVDEHNGASTYTTTYTYDPLGNLTRITDSLSNLRNFVYDGLSRFTDSEDLHASGDGTFGTWTYVYDLSGNLTSRTDPKSQVVNWTYDNINRVLTEDYTGSGGTEVTYTYDSCTEGEGRLCEVTTSAATSEYDYNPLGLVSAETKTIGSDEYDSSYTYDRQGNMLTASYPDASIVKYNHDSAGLLDSVFRKPGNTSTYAAIISDLDYAPTGQVSYKLFGNDVESTYTYDPAELYRLRTIFTDVSGMGGWQDEVFLDENDLIPATPGAAPNLPENLSVLGTSAEETAITEEFEREGERAREIRETDAAEEGSGEEVPKEESIEDGSTEDIDEEISTSTENSLLRDREQRSENERDLQELLSSTTTVDIATTSLDTFIETTTVATSTLEVVSDSINSLLEGKNARERGEIKAAEIAKLDLQGTYSDERYGVRVEIQDVQKIEGEGIQIFARAWKGENQLGFGKGGSVEIERFRIFNPPILVDDSEGDIIRESFDEIGQATTTRTLREDPEAAIRESLAHIISIVGVENAPIQKGKVGRTTSTFYPHDGTGDEGIDGNTARAIGGGETYSTLRTSTGNITSPVTEETSIARIRAASSSNKWDLMVRGLYGFDTSPIGADTVTSATLSVWGVTPINNGNNEGGSVAIVSVDLDSNTTYINADYEVANYGTTEYTTRLNVSSWDESGYNDLTLNGSGISYIDTGGVTNFSLRTSWDIDDTAPTWASNHDSEVRGRYADYTGTTNDPTLIVVHSAVAAGSGIQNLTYTYDSVGNITQINNASYSDSYAIFGFTYDDLYRLTSASTTAASSTPFTETYSYNSIGNITQKSLAGSYIYEGTGYTNPHAPTAIGSVGSATTTYVYDNNGNLALASTTAYLWDYRNRLSATGTIGEATTTYGYDHNNDRVTKKVGSQATTTYAGKYFTQQGATTTSYIWSGDTLIATVEGNGQATSTRFIHGDHLGSTNVITNENGEAVSTLDYYPFGDLRIDDTAEVDEKHKFTGHEFDRETDLTYAGARYYDQDIGKWISMDTASRDNPRQFLLDPQQLNGYSYARNNPLILFDPTGEKVEIYSKAIEANSLGTHVFLSITPDNPGDFSGMPSNWTVGAYADPQTGSTLIKKIDAQSDRNVVDYGYSVSPEVGYMKQRAEVQRPDGVTDTEFINRIMGQYNAYGEDAQYDPFARKGYNSNNFVSGLIENSGARLPWNGNARGVDPGYGQPIPSNYIKTTGQALPTGYSTVSSYAGQQGSQASSAAFQGALRALQGVLTKISNALSSLRSR